MGALYSAVITFFAGLGIILGSILLVYACVFIVDRLAFFNTAILTAGELEERRTASTLTRQAGLAGLLKDERNQIYRTFFEKWSFPYYYKAPEGKEESRGNEGEDLEGQSKAESLDGQIREDQEEPGDSNETSAALSSDGSKAVSAEDFAEMGIASEDDGNAPACSICLVDYDTNDKVILVPPCSHMFHFDCCMQWVDKGNEHCPYCRETMISSNEFYETALEVVGEERVAKLKRINEEAAVRVAALTTARRNITSNPVPLVGEAQEAPTEDASAPATTEAAGPVTIDSQTDTAGSVDSSMEHTAREEPNL